MGLSLGIAAGGVAKGYAQGEDIRNQKARREALELDTRTKREDAQRQDQQREAARAMPTPGSDVRISYDPSAAVDSAIAPRQAPAHHRAGLLGALGRYLDPEAAAMGSGVKPAPAMPAAGAAPAAAPGPQAGALPLKPGETEVDEVVGGPSSMTRQFTPTDEARYRWETARKTGDLTGERAAAKEFVDLRTADAKKGLMFADNDTFGNTVSELTGHDITVDQKGDKLIVAVDGKAAHTFGSREEMMGYAFSMMDRDPQAGLNFAMNARQEQRQSQLANAQMAGVAEQVRASRARTALGFSANAREQGKYDQDVAERKAVDDATALLSNPNNAVLYPDQWEAAATTLGRYMPEAAKGNVRTQDGATGDQTSAPVNTFSMFGQQHVEAYKTNPWVQAGVVAIAPNEQGVPRFWVKGLKGERIAVGSLSEAERRARSIYKQPPTANAKPVAPAAKQQPLM